MTIRDNVPTGAPCWVDLMSSDVEKSKAFYGELFGWTAEEPNPEFGGYTNLRKDGEQVAGLMAAQEEGMPDVWSVYLAVDDAEKTVEVAKANGAPGVRRADGRRHARHDGGPRRRRRRHDRHVAARRAPGRPGRHRWRAVPLRAAHPRLRQRRWRSTGTCSAGIPRPWATTPEFRYTLLEVADGENAGIMDASDWLPEGVPAHWSVYFAVDDVDAALAKVAELGGSTIVAGRGHAVRRARHRGRRHRGRVQAPRRAPPDPLAGPTRTAYHPVRTCVEGGPT